MYQAFWFEIFNSNKIVITGFEYTVVSLKVEMIGNKAFTGVKEEQYKRIDFLRTT